jgi:hypothetical protein
MPLFPFPALPRAPEVQYDDTLYRSGAFSVDYLPRGQSQDDFVHDVDTKIDSYDEEAQIRASLYQGHVSRR